MRDRKKQRLLKKMKEKGLSPKDHTGLPDPTPFEAVKNIMEEEKKKLLERLDEMLAEEEQANDAGEDAVRDLPENAPDKAEDEENADGEGKDDADAQPKP